jgi:hypothetical protein
MSLDIVLSAPGGKCPRCGQTSGPPTIVFERNYTHNVIPMWHKAGVYQVLYESEGRPARDYIDTLERGVAHFRAHYAEYEKLDAPNGWGLAKHALPFLEAVTAAFKEHPEATILVSK